MSALDIGDKAPDFTAPTDMGDMLTLSSLKGQRVVVYFYPKDDTPGCTKEACGFTEAFPAFQKLNAAVLGISKDSVKKHAKFRDKYNIAFPLVSDEETDICEKYGVWVEKSMYGKTYMGIERATFLIDETGKIAGIWRKVKVPGHVKDVQEAIENLERKAA